MTWARATLGVVLLWAGLCLGQPERPDERRLTADMGDEETDQGTQERFEAALALSRAGKAKEAAQALVSLARLQKDDDIAPEALFEAAQLAEEQLEDPTEALALYKELLVDHPQSRLARRAQHRADELALGLRTGVPAYLLLQKALRTPDRKQTIAHLTKLLKEYPTFVLQSKARYLLASTLQDLGNKDQAQKELDQLLALDPQGEFAPRAVLLSAQIHLSKGDYGAAEEHYRRLIRYEGSVWQTAGSQGLVTLARLSFRRTLARLSLGYLVLYVGYLLLGVFRAAQSLRGAAQSLRRIPFELWYYLPVAGFLVLTALITQTGPLAKAFVSMALAGGVLVWFAGVEARESSKARPWIWGLGLLARIVAAVALFYLVVYRGGFWDVLLETLKHGPETT